MENFYCQGIEYGIIMAKHDYAIVDIDDYCRYIDDDRSFVFNGTYAECLIERDVMIYESQNI